jgi:hypothetical protein
MTMMCDCKTWPQITCAKTSDPVALGELDFARAIRLAHHGSINAVSFVVTPIRIESSRALRFVNAVFSAESGRCISMFPEFRKHDREAAWKRTAPAP